MKARRAPETTAGKNGGESHLEEGLPLGGAEVHGGELGLAVESGEAGRDHDGDVGEVERGVGGDGREAARLQAEGVDEGQDGDAEDDVRDHERERDEHGEAPPAAEGVAHGEGRQGAEDGGEDGGARRDDEGVLEGVPELAVLPHAAVPVEGEAGPADCITGLVEREDEHHQPTGR